MEPLRESQVEYAMSRVTVLALGRWMASLLSILGAEVLGELRRFSKAAGPGAMITIRRTRDGFTAQVTGAIVGGRWHPPSASDISRIATDEEGGHEGD